jgi:hypothetical protein
MPYVGLCRGIALIAGALFLLGLSISHARHARKYFTGGASRLGALGAGLALACAVASASVIAEAPWAPSLAAFTAATSLLSTYWYRRRTRLQLAADALTVVFVIASAGHRICA